MDDEKKMSFSVASDGQNVLLSFAHVQIGIGRLTAESLVHSRKGFSMKIDELTFHLSCEQAHNMAYLLTTEAAARAGVKN